MMMMRASARSLPAVKMSCTLVAHLTLEQFTHVSNTKHTKVEILGKELVLSVQPQTHADIYVHVYDLFGGKLAHGRYMWLLNAPD